MNALNPHEASFEDQVKLIKDALQQATHDIEDIRDLSDRDFREWLDAVVQRIAKSLSIAAGTVAAVLTDAGIIIANAGSAFAEGFRESYRAQRRVERRRAGER